MTRIIRSNILFSKGNQYALLFLKQSKTNIEHTGVQIILAATGEKTYPVAALARFYILDLQLTNASLFRLSFGAFSHFNIITVLKKRIFLIGLDQINDFDHSFHKDMAQYMANYGILDEIIQKLGQ